MPKYLHTAEKIRLNSYNDLFGEEVESESIGEKLAEVSLDELHDFKGHPFLVKEDVEMEKLVESVREHGVLHPGIARPMKKGKGYELIAGHRRKFASKVAGKEKMPVFIKNYDDDEATIIMVDSNLQREEILPSEKARAYRMKYEAMKHQGKAGNGRSLEALGENAGESGKTVQRYIRLSYLIDDLLDLVDKKEIGVRQGVNISYLRVSEQKFVVQIIRSQKVDISIANTNRLRKESFEKELSLEEIASILIKDDVARKKTGFVMESSRVRSYFAKDVTDEKITEIIFQLLDQWSKSAKKDV